MQAPFLTLSQIHKSFGQSTVIDDLTLHIKKGTMVTLLGPSGCGKTTVLRLIAGLETADKGEIWIDGKNLTHATIQQRDICIVFQSYALFPHLTIAENVGYGLKMQGVNKTEREQRVKEALALVDLAGFEERYADQISGGQQQRVALARALILKPKVLLFDEPLSNLDANLRRAMREKIRELQQKLGITALYVTHDQTEAFAVSDEVIVMNKGKIVQQAPAATLYQQPNSLFIAHFMGESTLFDGKRNGTQLEAHGYAFTLPAETAFPTIHGECLIGVRPEAVKLHCTGTEVQRCRIKNAIYMGNHWEITAEWQGQNVLIHHTPENYQPMQEAYLEFQPSGIFLLPKA